MLIRNLLTLLFVATLAGCVTGYTLVTPGINSAEDLQVNAGGGWNLAPALASPGAPKGSQTWTQDGLLLNRLVIIPAIEDGETVLISQAEDAALPVFRKDMLPNEIEELMESSLVKLWGEGNVTVGTANLRPQTYGDDRGLMFDIDVKLTDSPDYRGTVGAFVADEKLYTIWYIAAIPHYHDKHSASAESIITSARVVRQ